MKYTVEVLIEVIESAEKHYYYLQLWDENKVVSSFPISFQMSKAITEKLDLVEVANYKKGESAYTSLQKKN